MKKKLIYIWDYYRFKILLVLLLLLFAISMVNNIRKPKPDLYVAYVDVLIGDDLYRAMIDESPLYTQAYRNLSLTDSEFNLPSQTKILGSINAHTLDLVIMNEDVMGAFAQNGYLMDMQTFTQQHFASKQEFFADCYTKNVDLTQDTPREYVAALDISQWPIIQKAGFQAPVYLGIIGNTEREDQIVEYITYLSLIQ